MDKAKRKPVHIISPNLLAFVRQPSDKCGCTLFANSDNTFTEVTLKTEKHPLTSFKTKVLQNRPQHLAWGYMPLMGAVRRQSHQDREQEVSLGY